MKKLKTFICMLLSILLFSGCTSNDAAERNPADVFQKPESQSIYFATGNDYYDLYVGCSWIPGPEIRLLSREYIDPKDIAVVADIQAEYTFRVTEQKSGVSLTSYEITEKDGMM